MQIIFIDLMSEDIKTQKPSPSLSLQLLSAIVKNQGFSTIIIDAYCNDITISQIAEKIYNINDDKILAFSIMSFNQLQRINALLTLIDMKRLRISHVTAGGFYASFNDESILKSSTGFDSILVREADITFVKLIENIINDRDWKGKSPGISYIDNNGSFQRKAPVFVDDLEILPFPDRSFSPGKIPFAYIQSSRGCYGKCSFCMNHQFTKLYDKKAWRYRCAESIFEEMRYILNTCDTTGFNFVDENFIGDKKIGKKRARELADLIIKNNLKIDYSISLRASQVDKELFKHLKASGLSIALIGIESFSSDFLKQINKEESVETNIKAIKILRELDLDISIGFIPYRPDTKINTLRKEFEALRRYVLGANLRTGLVRTLQGNLWVFKNTRFYKQLQSKGHKLRNDSNIGNLIRYHEDELVLKYRKLNKPQLRLVEISLQVILSCNLKKSFKYSLIKMIDKTALEYSLELIEQIESQNRVNFKLQNSITNNLIIDLSAVIFIAKLKEMIDCSVVILT